MLDLALFFHLISSVIWVGGMFVSYMCVRPAAASLLEPPLRLQLWDQIFSRFFPWVWTAVVLLPATGFWMIWQMGGFGSIGVYVHVMLGLGIAMILIFLHVYFGPYRRLKIAVAEQDFPGAGKRLAQIRQLIALNLILGLIIIAAVRLLRGV